MTPVETVILALALAIDSFAVGAAVGLRHREPMQIFRLSFHFGLFQALLPLIGAVTGAAMFLVGGAKADASGQSPIATLGPIALSREGPERFSEDVPDGKALSAVVRECLDAAGDLTVDELIGDLDLPILFFHGTADQVVPFAQGRDLAGLARQERIRFIPIKGADHNDLASTIGVAYFDQVGSFAESCFAESE